jgi:hypothetical protein
MLEFTPPLLTLTSARPTSPRGPVEKLMTPSMPLSAPFFWTPPWG